MSAPLRSLAALEVPAPVWGVDPAMKGCSICAILPPGSVAAGPVIWRTVELPGLPPRLGPKATKAEKEARSHERRRLYADRVFRARPLLRALFGEVAETTGPPAVVYVEQPFAQQRIMEPIQWFVLGVTLEVIATVLSEYGTSAEIVPIEPASWKAEAMGKGNGHAKKPEIMAWAREMAAYTGSIQDEADAAGVAACGAYRYLRELDAATETVYPQEQLVLNAGR